MTHQGVDHNTLTVDTAPEGIALRKLDDTDFEALVRLWTDADVAQFMGDYGPRDDEAVREWLGFVQHYNALPGEGRNYAIVGRGEGEFLGWIGFGRPSRPRPGELDFGYAVLPQHRGRGVATAALRAVLEHCLDHRGAASVYGECHVHNLASPQSCVTQACTRSTQGKPTNRAS